MISSPVRVVAVAASTAGPDRLLRSILGAETLTQALEEASRRPVELTLVSWLPSTETKKCIAVAGADRRAPLTDRILSVCRAAKVHDAFQRFALGRLINSLGPLDQSRVFWRAVQTDKAAMNAMASAEVLIAVDSAAVKTAWEMRRRNPSSEAYFGLSSTLKVFTHKFADSAR